MQYAPIELTRISVPLSLPVNQGESIGICDGCARLARSRDTAKALTKGDTREFSFSARASGRTDPSPPEDLYATWTAGGSSESQRRDVVRNVRTCYNQEGMGIPMPANGGERTMTTKLTFIYDNR